MKSPVEFLPINKVLLVDDDAAANYLSKELLEELHAAKEIEVAEDGLSAIDKMKQKNCPDIIFLDIKMPGMDGFDFLEGLKALTLSKSVKIVMLTSSVRPEDKEKAFTYKGVVDFFEKPLTPEKIQMVATTYLN
ncbi:response regulator [Niastella caeni]|uniref:Response regulator n=1 Tax=Niastella caeni TaxID=2569763 RepID=A0A4S8HFW2_9BACT|nr:response regulator [Niastella caeni]THU34038.1 response regulator [Niastella caeni]